MTAKKTFYSFKYDEPATKTRRRPKRLCAAAPAALTIAQILDWADAHVRRTGSWPVVTSGRIDEAGDDSWSTIDNALRYGSRGLGGSSLARLLAERRGTRNHRNLPALTVEQVLDWAEAQFRRTGRWPTNLSGPIEEAAGETWNAINNALTVGRRGLPGGTSLRRLLAGRYGHSSSLTVEQILGWADAHFRRTGRWPTERSGPIEGADDSWCAINAALTVGCRGLPGGTTLPRLLAEHRGGRDMRNRPPLTEERILIWADAHFGRTGRWPNPGSGPVVDTPDELWIAIGNALAQGFRGLPGGTTLARLLEERRGRRNRSNLPSLTVRQILGWADAHVCRTGLWPTVHSGPIEDAPGESWCAVNQSLIDGFRGLPGGSSLPRLLQEHRGRRNKRNLPSLRVTQIRDWADAHFRRTGRWPTARSGMIEDARGETWCAVNAALACGLRGLPGGSSLARLLDKHRRKSRRGGIPVRRD